MERESVSFLGQQSCLGRKFHRIQVVLFGFSFLRKKKKQTTKQPNKKYELLGW